MRSYIISLCVFCALLCYVHGATSFAKTCDEGKNPGDVWPDGTCGQCSCYSDGQYCESCGGVGAPDGCTFERYTGVPYPRCCDGEMVCPEK